jgi:hypothetical protein
MLCVIIVARIMISCPNQIAPHIIMLQNIYLHITHINIYCHVYHDIHRHAAAEGGGVGSYKILGIHCKIIRENTILWMDRVILGGAKLFYMPVEDAHITNGLLLSS